MNKPRDILFSFDNLDVASRFIDAVFAIPNMSGVTMRLEDVPLETTEESQDIAQQTNNSVMVPCQHVWVPYLAHPPIEQCTQCDAIRRAQHQ